MGKEGKSIFLTSQTIKAQALKEEKSSVDHGQWFSVAGILDCKRWLT